MNEEVLVKLLDIKKDVVDLENALGELIAMCERSDKPIDCFSDEFVKIKKTYEVIRYGRVLS